ncbi:3-phosphoserine/phosphohydroxythreonine transaminase [Dichelobacter nodosus]|uniref:Phosphoserine aminotransferase n=1 Tax=Dichelobacter nodosus (strain VCS1703A) TaxID=246195 RepID=SERC_DICNV|nr:3-phosphoserine/phosphohydroxythreonine transaminase [Dichelobacter nodosus]A5EV80.1 RecName: Full=Phosphoserine aminotransferase; AltName: Full=Phosphohydroxythreonine aminotransferase; Short=PSAT [Dichelobacter nodosus VCS1703A]ABQ13312.1 phosphoserine transaminase [Dichelobacter nodosus VCS1703A]AXM45535.1 3-phosphoserine/phosphohydroxythreonine transaminase [Dichelobacter nodosus]KNZ39892.1 phosphoserine aminotransferase [Dichelobacter nodosus]TGA66730.1 3-phosphoserine/phosphohydroxyth
MSKRVFNFYPGPCTLPLPVLQQAQKELLDFEGCGMSVMEISHRSQRFEAILAETLSLAKKLIGAPDDFCVLLIAGGAHQQFAMTALNLLADGGSAGIVNSGLWAKRALEEAQRVGKMVELWRAPDGKCTTLPDLKTLTVPKNLRYVHLTSNETVDGLQFPELPDLGVPLVLDVSSDYYTRPLPWDYCDIVYGGVQKNLAPSGMALVFVRKQCLREHTNLARFFCYKHHADANSLLNTPPTWQIYILHLVLKWIEQQGGVAHFAALAQKRSAKLYDFIDNNDFYRNDVEKKYRSKINVVMRTPSDALDTQFWQEAETHALVGLKGHSAVGGLRASLYNAMEMAGVEALIDFMHDFAQRH